MTTTHQCNPTTRSVHIGLTAPRDARRFVRQQLDGDAAMSVVDDAELLVSEVVTVATLSSGSTDALVGVSNEDGHVRVEVSDVHRGFALVPDGAALGLGIVDLVAPRWGVDLSKPGKTVWFELEVRGD